MVAATRNGFWETRRTWRGVPYDVWNPPVPRISDDFIDCCIYLYPSLKDAEDGAKIGGSGFLVSFEDGTPGAGFVYAVTNRHVVEGGNSTLRLNTTDGKIDIIDLDERNWFFHPAGDDLAVYRIPKLDPALHRYRTLGVDDHFISEKIIEEYNIGPGDDVFVVGRFINQEGKQRNNPSVRFGNIAQMPLEPIIVSRASGDFAQDSFIVEAKSIGGYSGSPVFVGMNPTLLRPERNGVTSNRAYLLGVCWGYIKDWSAIYDDCGRETGSMVQSNTGMMAVVPAWKLTELLMSKKVIDERNAVVDAAKKRMVADAVTLTDAAVPQSTGANPTHREDFTRLLDAAARKPPQAD